MVHSLRLVFLLPLLILSGTLTACRPPLPTRGAELIDYLRNSMIRAKARRMDHAAQDYATRLLGLYFSIQRDHQAVAGLSTKKSLWPLNDKRWKDKPGQARRKMLQRWLAPKKEPKNKDKNKTQPTRTQRLKKLHAMLQTPPKLPDTDPKQLTSALKKLFGGLTQNEHKAQQTARLHLGLVKAMQDPKAAPTQRQALWNQINAQIKAHHQHQLHIVRTLLPKTERLRDRMLREKKALRSKGLKDVPTWRRYLHLDMKVHYKDHQIKRWRKLRKQLKFTQKTKAGTRTPTPQTRRPAPSTRPAPTTSQKRTPRDTPQSRPTSSK